jgi:hypothetical protein
MPELSRFLGISIFMYYDDHNPPHFHVRYNDSRAVISINDLLLVESKCEYVIFLLTISENRRIIKV